MKTQINNIMNSYWQSDTVLELLHSLKVISRKIERQKNYEISTLCVDYSLEVSAMKNLSKFPANITLSPDGEVGLRRR